MNSIVHTCPCCGFPGLNVPAYACMTSSGLIRCKQPPYRLYFGTPSYEICSCCGFEFGNDDDPGTSKPESFEWYLEKWVAGGCIWFDSSKRSSEWLLEAQLLAANRLVRISDIWDQEFDELCTRFEDAKDSQQVPFVLLERYDALTSEDREDINNLIGKWLTSPDERRRYDAAFLIRERKISSLRNKVIHAINQIRTMTCPGVPFEVAHLERLLSELQESGTPNT